MSLRGLLVGLVALATVGFVVGTTIERGNAHHESAAQLKSEGKTPTGESPAAHATEGTTTSESGGESATTHAAEGPSAPTSTAEQHTELRPLGIDIEAVPFVVLAALASIALAASAWLRPRSLGVLVALIVAMVVFAALDV